MQKASTLFTDDQKGRIQRAVADAESKTSAEIVPVVASASGRYDRPEDIVGLWTAVIFLGCSWFYFALPGEEAGDWGFTIKSLELPAFIVAVVIGFVVGAALGTRVGWLRRLFTPRSQMRDEVEAKARGLFFDNRVHHTVGGTGILIYVSLFEHMASVIADETVVGKLGQDALDEFCRQLTDGLRAGEPSDAICAVITLAGERLASVFPRAEDDVNELPNALVTID